MGKKFKFKTNKKKEKWHIFSLTEGLSEQNELLLPLIYLKGNRELSLEGCKGVLEYKNHYIKLNLQRGSVSISGTGLDIKKFEGQTIVVNGKINSLEFCV